MEPFRKKPLRELGSTEPAEKILSPAGSSTVTNRSVNKIHEDIYTDYSETHKILCQFFNSADSVRFSRQEDVI